MTVESVTYISDLNDDYPSELEIGTLHEGNDHLRNIKKALLQTFPSVTGAVTATHTELNLLDGVTATTAELNILDGVTASAAELNLLDGVTALGITRATVVPTTSGTGSKAITGIPSWAKRITVMLDGVTVDGTVALRLRLGDASSYESSGYVSFRGMIHSSAACDADVATDGFQLGVPTYANAAHSGVIVLVNLTGNTWACFGNVGLATTEPDFQKAYMIAGTKTLTGVLTRLQLTTTDTYTAGQFNVLYE